MNLDLPSAARLVDATAAGIVLLGVLIAGSRSIGRSIWLLGAQSVLLGAAALVVGFSTGSAHLVAGGILTCAVKGIVVPLVLGRILRESPVRIERRPFLGPRTTLVIAILIVFVTMAAIDGAAQSGGLHALRALPGAIAEVLTGLLIAVTRRKVLSIVVGLLVFENGIALIAFSLTYGMPLVIELGIAFDLLVAIVVVRVYARRMLATFGTLSTDELRSLRG